nr:MAG TPA: hypothetical protein [Bacteriophage sp.]
MRHVSVLRSYELLRGKRAAFFVLIFRARHREGEHHGNAVF